MERQWRGKTPFNRKKQKETEEFLTKEKQLATPLVRLWKTIFSGNI